MGIVLNSSTHKEYRSCYYNAFLSVLIKKKVVSNIPIYQLLKILVPEYNYFWLLATVGLNFWNSLFGYLSWVRIFFCWATRKKANGFFVAFFLLIVSWTCRALRDCFHIGQETHNLTVCYSKTVILPKNVIFLYFETKEFQQS